MRPGKRLRAHRPGKGRESVEAEVTPEQAGKGGKRALDETNASELSATPRILIFLRKKRVQT